MFWLSGFCFGCLRFSLCQKMRHQSNGNVQMSTAKAKYIEHCRHLLAIKTFQNVLSFICCNFPTLIEKLKLSKDTIIVDWRRIMKDSLYGSWQNTLFPLSLLSFFFLILLDCAGLCTVYICVPASPFQLFLHSNFTYQVWNAKTQGHPLYFLWLKMLHLA